MKKDFESDSESGRDKNQVGISMDKSTAGIVNTGEMSAHSISVNLSQSASVPLLKMEIQREHTYPRLPTNINSWKIRLENTPGSVKANEVVLDVEIPKAMKHSTEGLQELEPVLSNDSNYTRLRYRNAGDRNITFFPSEKPQIIGIDLPQQLFINSGWADTECQFGRTYFLYWCIFADNAPPSSGKFKMEEGVHFYAY